MGKLGVITGTVFIDAASFGKWQEKIVNNEFGRAQLLIYDSLVFIPRHGTNPKEDYILPHRINHQANLQALQEIGVTDVVGINSTGSLKRDLKPGMIVIPDDFIMLFETPTIFANKPEHITPAINAEIRKELLIAAHECEVPVIERGIYWQTNGPRFETRAEIAMMSSYADIVGMTMGSEAVIAQELGLRYASLCSVDNYGNGLGDTKLDMEEIIRHAKLSATKMISIINKYLARRRK